MGGTRCRSVERDDGAIPIARTFTEGRWSYNGAVSSENCGSVIEGSLAVRTKESSVASMSSSGVMRVGGLIAAPEEPREA